MTNKQINGSQCTLPCASLVTFSQLFANSRSFHVPNYQRPYSWNERQRTELLQDIDRHERLTLKKNPEAYHFCGTIVCTPDKQSKNKFAIVDGQQRITTLTLIHAQLCRKVGKETFVIKTGNSAFLPQAQDRNVFFEILNGKGTSEPKTQAQSNYKDANKEIKNWIDTHKTKPEQLLELVEQRLNFIFFLLVDEHEVAKAFETINNRGKPLTQMDLVKNHLIYLSAINDWQNPDINEMWRTIQEIVSASKAEIDVDKVLRATVTAQFFPGKRKTGDTDFKIVARELPEDSTDKEKFSEFAKFLVSNFTAYSALRDAQNTDPNNQIIRALTHLNNHVSITGMLPLIFARQFRRKDHDKKDGDKDAPVLIAIEKANFRLYGLRNMAARSDSHNVKLAGLANEYFKGNIPEEKVISELKSLVTKGTKDGVSTIVQALTLNDNDEFDFYTWPWRRYFLARFEEDLLDKQSFPWSKFENLYRKSDRINDYFSVEHIWPQKAEDKTVAEYQKGLLVGRLGNLMLCPHGLNRTLSNKPIAEKQDKIGTAEILKLQQNNLEDFVKKTKDFIATLVKRCDERFGKKANRFNSKTLEKNEQIAFVKSFCDLREEKMIEFALREWRFDDTEVSDRVFEGVFSFAHSEETFLSDCEKRHNKSNENHVIVDKKAHSHRSPLKNRLEARNSVMKHNSQPSRWD